MIVSTERKITKCGIDMIIRTAGIQLNDFYVNPVMLNNHESDCDDVLGMWNNIQKMGTELHMDPVFDEGDEDSMKIKGKFERGIIKGASVGLSILNYEVDQDGTYIITESNLNEVSLTPQPANKATIVLSYNNKTINMSKMKNKKEFELFLNSDSPVEIPVVEEKEPIVELNATNDIDLNALVNEKELLILSLNEKDSLILSLKEDVQSLKQELEQIKESEVIKMVELDIEKGNGSFNIEQKDALVFLAKANIEHYKQLVGNSVKHNVHKVVLNSGSKDDKSNWNLGDWLSKDYKGLQELKLNDSERYDELVKVYYNKK